MSDGVINIALTNEYKFLSNNQSLIILCLFLLHTEEQSVAVF